MITLVTKHIFCSNCNTKNKVINAIKNNADIISFFDVSSYESLQPIDMSGVYEYKIIRDEFEIASKQVVKSCCPTCKSEMIAHVDKINWDNVLNFYPPSENEKWFRGFNELGKR